RPWPERVDWRRARVSDRLFRKSNGGTAGIARHSVANEPKKPSSPHGGGERRTVAKCVGFARESVWRWAQRRDAFLGMDSLAAWSSALLRRLRYRPGGCPNSRLNARLNAASDS